MEREKGSKSATSYFDFLLKINEAKESWGSLDKIDFELKSLSLHGCVYINTNRYKTKFDGLSENVVWFDMIDFNDLVWVYGKIIKNISKGKMLTQNFDSILKIDEILRSEPNADFLIKHFEWKNGEEE